MKGMKKYYTQKIMWYLLTLVFAVLLNFILPRLMPGDPVSVSYTHLTLPTIA